MALELTIEQESTVQGARRNDSELPYYYDSALRTRVQIGRDFEAYLILAPTDLKNNAIQWIKQVAGIQKVNKDRDTLVNLAATQEIANATAKTAAIDAKLQGFNTFRESLQISNSFAAIPELQSFVYDMQRVVEEMNVARERYQFDNVASQVIGRSLDSSVVTEPQIEQLQSWSGVLSEYLRG